jgi:hypothetical protein
VARTDDPMTPSERFLELAAKLGGISYRSLENFLYWHNPFTLQNWTLNVVELLIIGAAGLALTHAITVRRRTGDRSYLGVWAAATVYCIAMEVPIYFIPSLLGYDEGAVIFIHNEFTAGAFFGRMPLYILALYPGLLYPAYVLVRQRGLFDGRWGLIRGAVCVGVVHHCFYEVFDHLGPQLKWWLWDYELPKIGDITLGSVPLYSQVNFSLVYPIAFALLAHAFIGRRFHPTDGTGSALLSLKVAVMSVVVGVLTPPLGTLVSPNLIYARFSTAPDRAALVALSYGLFAAVALFAFWTFWRTRSAPLSTEPLRGLHLTFVPLFTALYLGVFALLWAAALPDYLNGTHGLTPSGTPLGSLPYAMGCAVACIWFTTPYLRAIRRPLPNTILDPTPGGSTERKALAS